MRSRAARAARALLDRRSPAGVAATYASVLDGEHLWLAVEAAAGAPAVRLAGTTDVHPLSPALVESGPVGEGTLAVQVSLLPLVATGASHAEVLWVAQDGTALPVLAPVAPVAAAPATPSPTGTPPTPDHRARLVARTGDDGTLVIDVEPLPPAVVVRSVTTTPDGVAVTVLAPPADAELLLVGAEDVRARFPLAAEDAEDGPTGRAVVTVGGLPRRGPGHLRLVVAGPDGKRLALRRRDDGLRNAHAAVMMPELFDQQRLVARFRWSGDGRLVLRMPHLAAGER